MQLLVSDANILIDLEEGQLLAACFGLPFTFAVPDVLLHEELEAQHAHLLPLGLELRELSGESVGYVLELTEKYASASRNDCFSLALARQEACPLLTGDKALRAAAEAEAVVVMGTLWLVEQMVRQGAITVEAARRAYALMKRAGRRLPWQVAEQQLRDLEQ